MSNMAEPGAYRWAIRLIAFAGAAIQFGWSFDPAQWHPSIYTSNDWLKMIWKAVGSAAVAVLVFQFFFERWIWRWDFLRKKLVRFPDLTGTWFVTSISETFGTTYKSVVTIDHHFDRIIIKSFRLTQQGDKVSDEFCLSCDIDRVDRGNDVRLFLVYENKVFMGQKYSADHTGCRVLTLLNEESCRKNWILQGDYWTNKSVETKNNRKGGTFGKSEMKWMRESSIATQMDDDVIAFLRGDQANA